MSSILVFHDVEYSVRVRLFSGSSPPLRVYTCILCNRLTHFAEFLVTLLCHCPMKPAAHQQVPQCYIIVPRHT